jgi:hypothetical protein
MNRLYARLDGKGDSVEEVVAFTGGDYNQGAILRSGDRLRVATLDDVRIVDSATFVDRQPTSVVLGSVDADALRRGLPPAEFVATASGQTPDEPEELPEDFIARRIGAR